MLSNQKMNAFLKELAEIYGIEKELTFHIARNTFAITVTLIMLYCLVAVASSHYFICQPIFKFIPEKLFPSKSLEINVTLGVMVILFT